MPSCHCSTVTATWETALILFLIFSYCHPGGPEVSDAINTFSKALDQGRMLGLELPLLPSTVTLSRRP